MSDLETILSAASEEGEFDSAGTFQISRERAWQKLTDYQAEYPEAWLGKLMQLALRVGQLVEMKQTRTQTTVWIHGFTGFPEEDLRRTLTDIELVTPDFEHLAVAVRLLIATQRSFSIRSRGVRFLWANGSFQTESEDDPSFSVTISHFENDEWTSIFSPKNFAARRRLVEIQQGFTKLAVFFPLPAHLDGRGVGGLFEDPRFGLGADQLPLRLWFSPSQSELPEFSLRLGRVSTLSNLHIGLKTRFSEELKGPQKMGVGGLITAYPYAKKAPHSELVWMRDGVPIKREKLPHCGQLCLCIVVDSQGLRTDLSTLKLVENEELYLRRMEALRVTSRWLQTHLDEVLQVHICQLLTELTETRTKRNNPYQKAMGLARQEKLMNELVYDIEFLRTYNFVEACR